MHRAGSGKCSILRLIPEARRTCAPAQARQCASVRRRREGTEDYEKKKEGTEDYEKKKEGVRVRTCTEPEAANVLSCA